MSSSERALIPLDVIQRKIFLIRGQKVMLDFDLAAFYQVENRALIQAVKRNIDRFPSDFMFSLSPQEVIALRSQIVISKNEDEDGRGGRRYAPYAFTEAGVAMLSSVLKSKRAIAVHVQIIRSFIKLRELLLSNVVLARRVHSLEQRSDEQSKTILQIIRELQTPKEVKKRPIGF